MGLTERNLRQKLFPHSCTYCLSWCWVRRISCSVVLVWQQVLCRKVDVEDLDVVWKKAAFHFFPRSELVETSVECGLLFLCVDWALAHAVNSHAVFS